MNIAAKLAEISQMVEPVAVRNPDGSDCAILAHAVRNLALCIEQVVAET